MVGLSMVKFVVFYIDYEYVELEGDEVGMWFINKGSDMCLIVYYKDIVDWYGVIGVQYYNSDYIVDGEEVFIFFIEIQSVVIFLIE